MNRRVDPFLLLPLRLPWSHGAGGEFSPLEILLMVGGFCMTMAVVIGAATVAYEAWPWLAVPAALGAYWVMMAVWDASPILMGSAQAIFFAGTAFIAADGIDRANPLPAVLAAVLVLALVLWATVAVWRRSRPQ